MKSIRSRLLFWFLIGAGVLWFSAGLGVFFSYRAGLLAGVQTELHSMMRQLRANQMGGRGGGWGWGRSRGDGASENAAGIDFGPDVYWEVWSLDDEAQTIRSPNLEGDLPRFGAGHGENVVRRITLPDGKCVLSIGGCHGGKGGAEGGHGRRGRGGRNRSIEITIAKDLSEVHQSLVRAGAAIILSGLLVAALAVWWVFYVVREGLAPLRRIADDVAGIDADSLGERISEDKLPEELQPIVRRLNQLLDRLEDSFARERRFSSDLAHEMRTPIAELRLLAESASKWPEDGGPEAWQNVLASVERMQTVVQAMLHLARLEQSAPDLRREPIPLRLLAEETWGICSSRAAERGVSLKIEVPEETSATGDPALWRHLLANLLRNTADYADKESEALLTAEPSSSGETPVVTIANNASNLSPENVTRLFDRFWRADEARCESSHCGLGLSLARACAEAMGLRLTAHLDPESRRLEMKIEPGKNSRAK